MKRNNCLKVLACCFFMAMLIFCADLSYAEPAGGSRLVGLLITTSDLSPYLGDDGVLWAEAAEGTQGADTEYIFGEVEGLRLICFITDTGDGESSFITNVDDGISRADLNIEDESSVSIEGTILYAPRMEEVCFFFNPVLQLDDGRIFAVPGDFMVVSADMDPPGASVGQTFRDERTHIEDDEEITDVTVVKLEIQTVREPLSITLLQFGADHELLRTDEYAPDDVPEEIAPLAGADYLLLETRERGADGGIYTRREVFGREEDFLNTRSSLEDGICIQQYHEIIWEDK